MGPRAYLTTVHFANPPKHGCGLRRTPRHPPVVLGDLQAHRAGGLQHVADRPAQRQQQDAAGAARAGPERVLSRAAGAAGEVPLAWRAAGPLVVVSGLTFTLHSRADTLAAF